MAEFNITADPEAINKFIAQSILESALGETIKKQAQESLTGYKLTEIVKKQFDWQITQAVKDYLLSDADVTARIKAAVIAGLTDEVLNGIVTKAFRNY